MKYQYYALCLDPVHIGAGGYRLGRVDNTIVREPATDIPKIPGTSMAGAIRAYTTFYMKDHDVECKQKSEEDRHEYVASKIVKYFGDTERQGMVHFYDAQIFLFPVTSVVGTVCITTRNLLEYWLKQIGHGDCNIGSIPKNVKDTAYVIKWDEKEVDTLNLGWLLLKADQGPLKQNVVPQELTFIERIAVVSDRMFSNIVNDNLEVRTSVRINSETGAAEDGGLFAYEAIPRGTVLGSEIVIDSRNEEERKKIVCTLEKSFTYLKLLGIGGMGTRGFGRLHVIESPVCVNSKKSDVTAEKVSGRSHGAKEGGGVK